MVLFPDFGGRFPWRFVANSGQHSKGPAIAEPPPPDLDASKPGEGDDGAEDDDDDDDENAGSSMQLVSFLRIGVCAALLELAATADRADALGRERAPADDVGAGAEGGGSGLRGGGGGGGSAIAGPFECCPLFAINRHGKGPPKSGNATHLHY